ncbi:MAG TPA: serine/threonine protein kinase [Pirellulaceae bacterium]|nr:serine/threonine protein kinase [Pirellulaceae bacterium]
MSYSLGRTQLFFKKQLWVWPIVGVLLLAAIGLYVRSAVESTMRASLQSELQTLLDVEKAMLLTWLEAQEANAESLANDIDLRTETHALLTQLEATHAVTMGLDPAASEAGLASPADAEEPASPNPGARAAPATARPLPAVSPLSPDASRNAALLRQALAKKIAPDLSAHDYVGYFMADKSQRIIAAADESIVGRQEVPEYQAFLAKALQGETTVSPPFPSVSRIKDDAGQMKTGVPTMYVVAPVRDENFQVVAALALQIRPGQEFTRILQLGRLGETGETYAFDGDGLMVSNSRFDEALILLGLLPDQPGSESMLQLSVRDPGGDMTQGFRPGVRRAELPLTKMASAATAGVEGIDLDGYSDYRGLPVVGAWTWLPKYGMGLATEVSVAEAYRPLTILRWTFWGLFALLGATSVAIFVFTVIVARLQREAQKAAVEAKKLGQYALEEKLGHGGMGVVYKGRHAMLRRPTAIKMLDPDKVTDAAIARFEHEVQITCQLNNPHTVAIYDYGRTPEGVFYYAMEYLDGIDLQNLVDEHGPQGDGRVAHILKQICESLYEAHCAGLVHRDVKPANVMLTRRGGIADMCKTLDFGLVKAVDERKLANISGERSLTGTPLYMSPEAIQSAALVDARSDLYAVGAVGYFLLTGRPPFESSSLVELCRMHVSETPVPPSERDGAPCTVEIEAAIMKCLEKNPAKRPQTARELAKMLDAAPVVEPWSTDYAEAWWIRRDNDIAAAAQEAAHGPARGSSRRRKFGASRGGTSRYGGSTSRAASVQGSRSGVSHGSDPHVSDAHGSDGSVDAAPLPLGVGAFPRRAAVRPGAAVAPQTIDRPAPSFHGETMQFRRPADE